MTGHEEFRFTDTHEWVKQEEDVIIVGVTEYRQRRLSDIVRIEFPDPGDKLIAEETAGILEGVNDTVDFCAPVDGKVTEVNDKLLHSPELVNTDPYGDGWLFKMKPKKMEDLEGLIDEHEYEHSVGDDDE